jgi:predicted permease
MDKLLFSLAIILSGLALGYVLQTLDRNRVVQLPLPIAQLRKMLQRIGLLFFMPISFMAAVWIVSFADLRVMILPVIGVGALLAGGLLGMLVARLMKQPTNQSTVLFCCGSFSNLGAIGTLACYMFLGEAGLAFVVLYRMFEEIYYYAIAFPVARFYSGSSGAKRTFARRLLDVLKDPFVAAALSAFFIGLFLNLAAIPRPAFFEMVIAVSVPAGTFILIVSIGLSMHVSRVGSYLHESLLVCLIKFAAVPVLACSLAYLSDLHLIADGIPFKVVLVLSAMPVAINALVAASIYDLDLDLANSCWLVTTLALLVVLPLLYFLLSSAWLV